jgi:hypothetical protein
MAKTLSLQLNIGVEKRAYMIDSKSVRVSGLDTCNKRLTATRVGGRKSIPSAAIVFIDEPSFLVSIAMVLMTSLSSLLALARNEVSFATLKLSVNSFCAIKRDT